MVNLIMIELADGRECEVPDCGMKAIILLRVKDCYVYLCLNHLTELITALNAFIESLYQ